MMKKFFYSVLAAATMLLATTSCSQEEEMLGGGTVDNGTTQKVTFKVGMPDESVASRAIEPGVEVGGGNKADKLIWALYEKGYTTCLDSGIGVRSESKVDGKYQFTADIYMVKGLTYNVLFFAYDENGCAFQINAENAAATDLTSLTLKDELYANQEGYDAFVKCYEHTVKEGNLVTEVELQRPFAQINAATTDEDLARATKLGANVIKSQLVIEQVPTKYNILKDEVSEYKDVTYIKSSILTANEGGQQTNKNEKLTVKDADGNNMSPVYNYLNMAYVLAGNGKITSSTHNATFTFYRDADVAPELVRTIPIINLPIERNWRTNVVGDLLTEKESFKIIIDHKFGGDHNIDGPAEEAETKTVATVTDLQDAIDNATGHTIIKFTQDIDANSSVIGRSATAAEITIRQKEGLNLVIDGCDFKFNGTFYIEGKANYTGEEALTLQNIQFETEFTSDDPNACHDFISSNSTESEKRYAHNVKILNCSFKNNGTSNAVAMRYRQAYNMSAENCTATNLHSFAQITASEFAAYSVTVSAKSGFNFLTSGKINIENCNITATDDDGYGVRIDAYSDSFLNIKGTTINAYEPIVLRNSTPTFKLNLENNTLNKTSDYHIVVKSGEIPEITGADNYNVYPLGVVASNSDELIAALTKGMKVKMLNDIVIPETTTIVIGKDVESTLDLNEKTLSSTNSNTATHNFFMDVKGGTLTINNGTIEYKHTGNNMGWNGAATVIDITAGGVLNMNNVVVENLGGTDMNFAVHMNNWGEVTLNAENCEFLAPYCGVRVFNSGYDDNNVTIKNSKLTGGTRAFWVHNYIGDLNSTQHSDEAIKNRLKFSIFNNNNTFEITGEATSPIRYGFNNSVYYILSEDGNELLIKDGDVITYAAYYGDEAEVTVPEGVVATGTSAFAYSNVKKVVFPNTLETLGGYTFQECSSLESVNLPEGLKTIGNRAFRKTTSLSTIQLPNSLETVIESAFQQSGVTSIVIPENVTSIGKMAFGACGNLETITINAKNVTIGDYCARACTNLKSVYIYSETISFANGSMYFTNKENADASKITFYVTNKENADILYNAMSVSHSYGMKIVSIDGSTEYYNTLK